MADHTAAARSFYGRWARLYDVLATAPGVTGWRERAVDALALDGGDTVVEMGCGTGANLPLLRDRVGPDGQVLGLDVTRDVLDLARDRAHDAGWRNVDLLQADATRLPLRQPVGRGSAGGEPESGAHDNISFEGIDAVLATFVVGMFREPAAAVADWCELVGPGGRVALLNFQQSDRLLAQPLQLVFETFVWLSSPGRDVPTESPAASLGRRVDAARTALVDRTVDRRYETLAGGYLGLVSGRVAERF